MFLPLSFSSLGRRPPPLPDLLLCSPQSLLRRNLDLNSDLNPELNLFVNGPDAAVPLDLFLPLLWGDLDLNPDLFLAFQEDPPIPLP